jgi:hypothetical protein
MEGSDGAKTCSEELGRERETLGSLPVLQYPTEHCP